MATIATLALRITGNASGLKSALSEARSSVESAASTMQSVGGSLTAGVTLPLLGMGLAAVKASTDFNAGMANVASLGVPIERVNEFKGAVQEMSVALGKSTTDLSDGLYQVISAFGDSADTVEVLEINAAAGAAGLATTTDAINLTSAVTKAYGDTSAGAVQQVSDLAFQTAKLGQTTFPELAASIGRVAPLAATLGVGMEEMFGTMATFTGVTGSASEVSTQLRGVLQALMAPTESMSVLMAGLGFESGSAMVAQLGLQGSIEAIVGAAESTGAPLQAFIGSIEGQTLALAATGGQAATFAEKLAAMGQATGATDEAFAAQTEGVNALGFEWAQLQARLDVFVQKMGNALGPALMAGLVALEPLVAQVEGLATAFVNLDPGTQSMLLGLAGVAVAAGPVIGALGFVATAVAAIASPVGLVLVAVALLGAAWATNFLGIRDITVQVWAGIQAFFTDAQNGFPLLQAAAAPAIEAINGKFVEVQTAVGGVVTALGGFWEWVMALGGTALNMAVAAPEWIAGLMGWAWPNFPVMAGWLSELLKWTWPLLGPVGWVMGLMAWAWPAVPGLPAWIGSLMNWEWPSFEMPDWLDQLFGWSWPAIPQLPSWLGGAANNQLGTSYAVGGLSWVGEAGPELVMLPRGAQVWPTREAAQASGVTVVVQQAVIRDERDLYALAQEIDALKRRRNR